MTIDASEFDPGRGDGYFMLMNSVSNLKIRTFENNEISLKLKFLLNLQENVVNFNSILIK